MTDVQRQRFAPISVSAISGCVTIEVSDDAPGVQPDDLPRTFECFYPDGPWSDGCGSRSLGAAKIQRWLW